MTTDREREGRTKGKTIKPVLRGDSTRGMSPKNRDFSHFMGPYLCIFTYRGSPHAHTCLYIVDENGESAPSLWKSSNDMVSEEAFEEQKRKIETINDDLISASLQDAKCLNHDDGYSDLCEDCIMIRDLVSKFQCHHCTVSCKKKKRYIHIHGRQGLGVNEEESCEIITHVCRYKFPRCPVEDTVLLLPISKSEDPKEVAKMMKDWKHIRSYLIRRGHFLESKTNEDVWLKIKTSV